jgi:glycerophosphoryl diester phosphodiesterase
MQRNFTSLNHSERDHVLRIAHRGASAYALENSLMAFEKAAEMQADIVEVDVRVTADHIPVIAHDADLKRLYGINKAINECTSEELRAVVGDEHEPIPTFDEVARLCADLRMGLYLDVKDVNQRSVESMLASLQRVGLFDYTIWSSFRPDFVAEFKAQIPTAKTSILFGSTHINPVRLAQAVSADFVHPCWENAVPQPHQLLTSDWIEDVREHGLGIICWHEERPDEITALRDLGVDGICSDRPDLLAELL